MSVRLGPNVYAEGSCQRNLLATISKTNLKVKESCQLFVATLKQSPQYFSLWVGFFRCHSKIEPSFQIEEMCDDERFWSLKILEDQGSKDLEDEEEAKRAATNTFAFDYNRSEMKTVLTFSDWKWLRSTIFLIENF